MTARAASLLFLLPLGLASCSVRIGPAAVLAPDASAIGLKLLRPAVRGRSCRTSVLGLRATDRTSQLGEALAEILALDPEGNVVVNAEIRLHAITTGVYNRRCLEVRGDLARSVRTVVLPGSPGHGEPDDR